MQELKNIPTEQLVAELIGREGVKMLKVLEKDQGVHIRGAEEQTKALPAGTSIVAICPDQPLG
ncbi:MAG: hypothetical protein IJ060_02545 [Oscillospiraceae bacterium]|nr:hypothetical protein [Oscillospiraceae bacterium]